MNKQSAKAVGRYWRGKAPEGAPSYTSDNDEDETKTQREKEQDLDHSNTRTSRREERLKSEGNHSTTERTHQPSHATESDLQDRRMRRLHQQQRDHAPKREIFDGELVVSQSRTNVPSRSHRSVFSGEVVSVGEQDSLSTKMSEAESETNIPVVEDTPKVVSSATFLYSQNDGSQKESSSEEEEDESLLYKPIFVPKNQRETIIEKEKKIQEQESIEKLNEERKVARQEESVQMIIDDIQKDINESMGGPALDEFGGVDDTDMANDENELRLWKIRELKRLKRDKDEMEAYLLKATQSGHHQDDGKSKLSQIQDSTDAYPLSSGKGVFYQS